MQIPMNKTHHPRPHPPTASTLTDFNAADGLVRIRTTSTGLKRWPPHNYRCVLLELRPRTGTRIQALTDGSGGIEAMLTHQEVRAILHALNHAEGSEIYVAKEVKGKPIARVNYWKRRNRKQFESR